MMSGDHFAAMRAMHRGADPSVSAAGMSCVIRVRALGQMQLTRTPKRESSSAHM
jgi:hypothetical protein